MENMDMLVRGVVMPGSGMGLGSIGFQGLEWAWVAIVATIVVMFVSAKRVSIVSVGWTWGAKPGQVRVRVHSFSSMSDGSIVAASGMFSAGIVNCSADSCSEDASSSSDCASEAASKVAAEMVFIFEKKTPPNLLLAKKDVLAARDYSDKIFVRRSNWEDFRILEDLPFLVLPHCIARDASVVKRTGIQWGTLPAASQSSIVIAFLPSWAQSLTEALALLAPPSPSCIVPCASSFKWDPLLKLRMRDTVVCDNHHINHTRVPIAPVAMNGAGMVTFKNNIVRLWDNDTRLMIKGLHLPMTHAGAATAFDANWERKVAAVGDFGGLVSIANLESAALETTYDTLHPVVQSVHLDRSSLSKTLFTGGPAITNPGCTVSLWDSRSSNRQYSVNLSSASYIYGICAQGYELFVRDSVASLAAFDLRMLSSSCLRTVPCDVSFESAPKDKWWDIDTPLEVEDGDIDAEFWDCQSADKSVKGAKDSYVGSFVKVMSRNFSMKSTSK